MHRTVLSALLAAALSAATPAAAQDALQPGGWGGWKGDHVPGEVIVKFRPSAPSPARSSAVRARGHALVSELDRTGWTQVRTAPGESVEQALAAYAADPDVEWAQPNYVYRTLAIPNDPYFQYEWAARNTGQSVSAAPTQPPGEGPPYPVVAGTATADMRLDAAWDHLTDCSGVVVAVVDSGVNGVHPDLAANMWDGGVSFPNHGRNFVPPAPLPGGDSHTMDLAGHGTHVAGTIGAVGNNGLGVAGVCWSVQLMAIRTMDETGSGTTTSIVPGILWAVDHGAQVINLSLGAGTNDPAFGTAITYAQNHDVVVVVAAGNGGADGVGDDNDAAGAPTYPCNYPNPNLVCVAALDQNYDLASFSNYGPVSVDVGAPGTNIVSTWPGPVFADPLDAGWYQSSTTGGGWAYASVGGRPVLADPGTAAGGGSYTAGTDDRAWKTFDLTGALGATLEIQTYQNLGTASSLGGAWRIGAGDPFPGGTSLGSSDSRDNAWPNPTPYPAVDVSGCISSSCTLGIRLLAGATGGAVIVDTFRLMLVPTSPADSSYPTSFHTISGTSMASPNVAGVAALVRAFDPGLTALDVVGALTLSGPSVQALQGKTTTGRAVDALSAISFVNAPRNLTWAER